MKRICVLLIIVVLVFSCVADVCARSVADFVGTWKYEGIQWIGVVTIKQIDRNEWDVTVYAHGGITGYDSTTIYKYKMKWYAEIEGKYLAANSDGDIIEISYNKQDDTLACGNHMYTRVTQKSK